MTACDSQGWSGGYGLVPASMAMRTQRDRLCLWISRIYKGLCVLVVITTRADQDTDTTSGGRRVVLLANCIDFRSVQTRVATFAFSNSKVFRQKRLDRARVQYVSVLGCKHGICPGCRHKSYPSVLTVSPYQILHHINETPSICQQSPRLSKSIKIQSYNNF